MKYLLLLTLSIIVTSCEQSGANLSGFRKFDVPNQIQLASPDTLSLMLKQNPPAGLIKLALCSGDTVLREMNWPAKSKKGDVIKIPFKFQSKRHYSVFAVGNDMQHDYYELGDHDFVIVADKVVLKRR
jgi:hypothetical protein